MYEILLRLPLFQGMSRSDLNSILAHVPLEFGKGAPGDYAARESAPCDRLTFLLGGRLSVSTWADDRSYMFEQQVLAPDVLQPAHLFGLHHHYTHDFRCLTPCQFLSISKQSVMVLFCEYIVFRLNFLNMLSTQTHKLERELWHQEQQDVALRICRFFSRHAVVASGAMDVKILMLTLAREIGCSRLEVSKALHQLQEGGMLSLSRGAIHIDDISLLISKASNT